MSDKLRLEFWLHPLLVVSLSHIYSSFLENLQSPHFKNGNHINDHAEMLY